MRPMCLSQASLPNGSRIEPIRIYGEGCVGLSHACALSFPAYLCLKNTPIHIRFGNFIALANWLRPKCRLRPPDAPISSQKNGIILFPLVKILLKKKAFFRERWLVTVF